MVVSEVFLRNKTLYLEFGHDQKELIRRNWWKTRETGRGRDENEAIEAGRSALGMTSTWALLSEKSIKSFCGGKRDIRPVVVPKVKGKEVYDGQVTMFKA